MRVRIANIETLIRLRLQKKQSDLGFRFLSRPFLWSTSVRNFR